MSRVVEDVEGRAVGERLERYVRAMADADDEDMCEWEREYGRRGRAAIVVADAEMDVLTAQCDALVERVRVLEEAAKTIRADAFEEAAGIVETVDRDSGTWVGGTLCNVRRRFASAIRAAAQVKP